jgi:TolB-like protein/Flp pilus assembly protein TadD
MPERSLLERLKKRKLVQWALAYLAGSWVLFEASDAVGGRWGLPDLIYQGFFVLLVVGFFVTLVLAWYHGEKGRQRVSGPELLMVAALLVVAGAALWMVQAYAREGPLQAEGATPAVTVPTDGPSVAVLPFANLSRASDDAYLADGLHEEVIGQLAKIAALRVVSRTSVMAYRAPGRPIRQIAAELGVAAVLEGSLQKVGDRIRVTAQLIDAANDDHLWAETFDREFSLESILDLQAEIARKIASALRAEMTPEEGVRMERRHTENWDAYQAFLRGRYYLRLPHYTVESQNRALDELYRAVELDSTFALAWAKLAQAHAQEVFYWTDASKERRELARSAAQKAMEMDPPSPEVRLALGLTHLWLDRDAERALAEIALAEEELPNNQGVLEARAYVYELEGRFQDAIQEYRKVLKWSPRDPGIYTYLALIQWVTRDYDAGEASADQAISLAPDQLWPNLAKVLNVWGRSGATGETGAILEALPQENEWVIWARYWQLMFGDRYSEAIGILNETEVEWIRVKMWARPKPLLEAMAYMAMGQTDTAARLFEEAERILEREVEAYPNDPRYHSSLGLAYAGLGRAGPAIREGERAVALLPISRDAFYGLPYLWDLTAIYAMVGDGAAATSQLEQLLSIPSWISPTWLAFDFRLDGIRRDPRFQALGEKGADEVEH